jgi:paraquat-inducible protein B
LQQLTQTLQSLNALSDYLERHPESLIRGKKEMNKNEEAHFALLAAAILLGGCSTPHRAFLYALGRRRRAAGQAREILCRGAGRQRASR